MPIVPVPTPMPEPPPAQPADPDVILLDDDTIGFPQVLASLITVKVACLSIHSDSCYNPLSPGYNLKVPPTTYDEVMRHPDKDHS